MRDYLKTRESYIINPEGRVNKCNMKPQPSKYFQLRNSQKQEEASDSCWQAYHGYGEEIPN